MSPSVTLAVAMTTTVVAMATFPVLVADRATPPPEYRTVLTTVGRHVRQRPSQRNRGRSLVGYRGNRNRLY